MATVYEKMKKIADNIRLRTGGTEPLSLDDIAEAILTIGGEVTPQLKGNLVPYAIDTDGSIYDGDGWIAKKRLSSSGVLKDANYVSTTGFIPASSGAIIRIGGCQWIDTTNATSSNYVCSYDANFNFICAVNCAGSYGGGTVSGDSSVAVVTLPTNENIAYVRVSAYGHTINGAGETLIVTVNEEIE